MNQKFEIFKNGKNTVVASKDSKVTIKGVEAFDNFKYHFDKFKDKEFESEKELFENFYRDKGQ